MELVPEEELEIAAQNSSNSAVDRRAKKVSCSGKVGRMLFVP